MVGEEVSLHASGDADVCLNMPDARICHCQTVLWSFAWLLLLTYILIICDGDINLILNQNSSLTSIVFLHFEVRAYLAKALRC